MQLPGKKPRKIAELLRNDGMEVSITYVNSKGQEEEKATDEHKKQEDDPEGDEDVEDTEKFEEAEEFEENEDDEAFMQPPLKKAKFSKESK